MNFTNTRYYEILGVTHDASQENLYRARNRLKFGREDDRVPFSQWSLIDEAYDVLSDPDKRKAYDSFLRENETKSYSDFLEEKQKEEEMVEEQQVSSQSDELDGSSDEENLNEEEAVEKKEPEEESKIEEDSNSDKEDSDNEEEKEVNPSGGAQPFTHLNEKFSDMSFEYKMKTIAKYLGVAFFISPTLAAVIAVWMHKNKGKIKLHKDKAPKKITEVKNLDLQAFKEYEQNLNTDIDKLLAEKHNNYRLEINKKKYENQIDLLQKRLEVRINRHLDNRYQMFSNKLQVKSISQQLATARKNLENVSKKIEETNKDKMPRLARLNDKLIKSNQEIAKLDKDTNKTLYGIKKLSVKQSKLLHKRNEKGTAIKNRVVRLGKFYDGIVKAKDFVVTSANVFVPAKRIYNKAEEMEAAATKVR